MAHLIELEGLGSRVVLDSAGTGNWHVGARPDRRAQATAKRRGFELPGVARQFRSADFERFDYVLAMDRSNRKDLHRMANGSGDAGKIHLLRDFDPSAPKGAEVPDPYYGGDDGFDEVFDIVHRACSGLLDHLRREHSL